jgi:2-oxoglutarate dehydrogenase E2 component (dihydrolipoamide succinyltransferase)
VGARGLSWIHVVKGLTEREQILFNECVRVNQETVLPSDLVGSSPTFMPRGQSARETGRRNGSLIAAPIVIPQPQSAIFGVGKLGRRPVARERSGKDVVEVRPMCYVTLTIDHRVLDGYQANAFLARWVEEIEGWR